MPVDLEGGKAQRRGEAEAVVAEEREGDVLALGELALFGGALGADPDHGGAERVELGEGVAIGAALRRAAPGAGDVVPALRQGLARDAGPRVDVGD